ncbi:hypothetical protein PPYR_11479 [Photinus pyralis]|uniref:Chloride channel CLIC-like protein 1 n=1 Tax=Photinus pyralis TaxID=7054 RepID=A0A5N4ABD5_PHOPY|nr:uncharacterized protein LOC116176016 isoform X2 [Photinus pyralis]KAB0794640.1 hypothetical protein PPYR_11479 [Photinus pyralis]
MTLSIIILLLIAARSVVITNQQSDWIDPHDMNNGKDLFRDNTEFLRPTQAQCETKLPSDCPPTLSLSHYKRLISLILNLVKLDEASSYSGRLTLRLSTADYKFLLGFIRESGDVENVVLLRKIEQVMSRVMTKSRWEHAADLLVTWTDSLYFNFFNRTTAITATCMLVLVISYKLLKASFTIWLVMKCLILLGWIVDFGFRWMSLIQDAEINQMADMKRYESVPPYCDPSKMNWFQYLTYTISSDSECRRYHHTMHRNVFYDVAPLQVMSNQLGIIVYTPAIYMGKAVGTFVSGMLDSLPWGVNVILLPVLLLFTLVLICIILSFCTETSFGLNLAYLIQFHFGNRQREAIGDMLSGRNLSAILNIAQRNMIEDVSPQTVNDQKTEPCSCRDSTVGEVEPKSPETKPSEALPPLMPDAAEGDVII